VNLGIIDIASALKMAQGQALDLVEINPKSNPPVCKIMDYGKYKYEENKKLKDSKKNQHTQEIKEITFGPHIEKNDLNHKLAQTKDF
jgi:translation initiation factor IF-3